MNYYGYTPCAEHARFSCRACRHNVSEGSYFGNAQELHAQLYDKLFDALGCSPEQRKAVAQAFYELINDYIEAHADRQRYSSEDE